MVSRVGVESGAVVVLGTWGLHESLVCMYVVFCFASRRSVWTLTME